MPPTLQFPTLTFPSLESLPSDSAVRQVYPDDTYPNDIYGRGYSEAPTEILSNNDYITQLALLLQFIAWTSTYVVGMSMGGGITAAFTSTFPHLVNGKIVLLASAGIVGLPVNENGERTMPSLSKQLTPGQSGEPELVAANPGLRELQASSLPGYSRILQDSMRYGPIAGLSNAFEALATTQTANGPLKVLVVHGTNDSIVPYTEAAKIKALVPQAEVVTVEGADHSFLGHPDHWPIVTSNTVRFLSA
ncbi:hypothetical protein EUX98_g5650 [Antrodiella citrinella]|uniref:AB hydrolase-1 domain-containing protein n=1 Tax=Antrodiella citrinella TaxID=2447956 RepID=A0A4S4MSU5_9APHY|nr:hypothetical protein EUX98_g5650 [Antrodiella citrinella]